MFGSKSTKSPDTPTVIGQGALIQGTVRIAGRVQLDGEIEGTLEVDGHVSIGPKGKVLGDLIGDDIAVGGEVEGKVIARKHLHVVSSGVVRGEVRYATLQIDRGAVLDGRTAHGDEDDAVQSLDVEVEDKGDAATAKSTTASKADGKDDPNAKKPPVPPPAAGGRKAPAPMGAS